MTALLVGRPWPECARPMWQPASRCWRRAAMPIRRAWPSSAAGAGAACAPRGVVRQPHRAPRSRWHARLLPGCGHGTHAPGRGRAGHPVGAEIFRLPDVISALAPRHVAIFNGVNPLGQELTIRRLREQYAGVAGPPEIAVRDRDEEPFVPLLERVPGDGAMIKRAGFLLQRPGLGRFRHRGGARRMPRHRG